MKFKIWDKQESINGVEAEVVLNNNPLFKIDDVFLILNEYDIVTHIESVRTIKSVYKLDKDMSIEDVAQYHIDEMEKVCAAAMETE